MLHENELGSFPTTNELSKRMNCPAVAARAGGRWARWGS